MTDTKNYFGFQLVQYLEERIVSGIEGYSLRLLVRFRSNTVGYTFCNQEKWKFKNEECGK